MKQTYSVNNLATIVVKRVEVAGALVLVVDAVAELPGR
jgi:hypothetical protein